MNALLRYLVLPLAVLAALAAAWLWLAWHWSYSSGERAGWVQQFSKRGWICKTWEGELALVSLPGSTTEKFFFTVHDDAVAARISRLMGKRVSLHFEEKVGLPTSCFGETRYFVTGATEAEEIPLGPGVVLPSAAPPSAAAATAASSASETTAPAASAASR
ncbi:MAG: hypothetical protein KGL78_10420 [Burkholderiales bacterium]|nr:hypothetical protein [Burkholderiales bacterium]